MKDFTEYQIARAIDRLGFSIFLGLIFVGVCLSKQPLLSLVFALVFILFGLYILLDPSMKHQKEKSKAEQENES